MKKQLFTQITGVCTALIVLAVASANALTDTQMASIKKAFDKVPVPELAAKAAQVVAQTPAADREPVAVAVTRVVVTKNAAVVASLVSAIATVAPEVAPAIAAEAAALARDYAEAIALAAANAAPAYAEKIAQAIAAAVPSQANAVTARVRSSAERRAAGISASGTWTIIPGVLAGVINTPTRPPVPAPAPLTGYDPKRYQQP